MSDTAVAAPAAPKPFKIRKEIAVAIFGELGTPTAAKWPKERLEEKLVGLAKAEDAADTVLTDENNNGAFHALITAVTAGRPVDVTGFGAAAAPVVETGTDEGEEAPAAKPAKKAADPKPAEESVKQETGDTGDSPSVEEWADYLAEVPTEILIATAKLRKRKRKPKMPGAPRQPRTPRSESAKGNHAYCGGAAIKKVGMAVGLTSDTVAALDEIYGKPNPYTSPITIRAAWHSIRGYLEGSVEDLVPVAVGVETAVKTEFTEAKGVRAERSRPYLAGVVLKKHGLDAKITDAMVAEVDTAYTKVNPKESKSTIAKAASAIAGYLAE